MSTNKIYKIESDIYFLITFKLLNGFVMGEYIHNVDGKFVSEMKMIHKSEFENCPMIELNNISKANVIGGVITSKVSRLIDNLL